MKKLLFTLLISSVLTSISYSQYNYGLDVCGKDARIEGKLNLDAGNNNLVIGLAAGINIQAGSPNSYDGAGNTFVGHSVGLLNAIGRYNTFVGNNTGITNVSGSFNTFMGAFSGRLTTGNSNTFFGHSSGMNNSTGEGNSFIGGGSGNRNEEGQYNTFLGQDSGFRNKTGSNNVYLGLGAAYQCETCSNNVIVGYEAGWSNTSGINNTYLGYYSGNSSIGSNNVFLGYNSGSQEMNSNRLYIENSGSSIPLIYGEFDNDKIQINGSLHISKFTRLIPSSAPTAPEKGTMYYDSSDDKVKVWTGSAWENLFFTSSTQPETSLIENIESPCNTSCIETLNASIQRQEELAKEKEALKDRLISVETELQEMRRIVNVLAKKSQIDLKVVQINRSARLEQNVPNPFNGRTKIQYFIPNNIKEARLKIFDINGQVVKNIEINSFGKGEVEVQVDEFLNGIYHYSLEVDGKIIDTKKMSSIK